MLNKLIINNIALIDNAEISFKKGLNVLSGETGSGKSVILDSLNFVLGAKADKTMIRHGENSCKVTAEFDISNLSYLKEVMEENDFDVDDTLIITRKFNVDGRGDIRLNGNVVTLGMLKKFTAKLIDVHGQSEHFYLLKESNQLELLDKFSGSDLSKIKDKIKGLYVEYRNVLKELKTLGGTESEREYRLDLLEYQIKEIETADVKENEIEELIIQKERLNNLEKISSAFNTVIDAVKGDNGVNDRLAVSSRNFSSIINFDEKYQQIFDRLENVRTEIDDIAYEISNLSEELGDNEYDINGIEERIETVKKIQRKYGKEYEDIQKTLEDAINERDRLLNFNILAEKYLNEKTELEDKLYKEYISLRETRKHYAKVFSENVLAELKELGMPYANFEILFDGPNEISDCKFDSDNGIDTIEFNFSANLGEPCRPLSKIVSGGEISRFMLAVKSQTAKYNDISTFIFDEIDAGISGIIAKVVGKKFIDIARDTQVIAVTHLPQIMSMGDNCLYIEKKEDLDKTVTTVKELDENGKINEVVRLVGGNINSESAILHAKELLKEAKEYKDSIY
ncbi:MAG: DNA repair protein RecN [Clostridiales bacterium]|nr:DNA repair protein RecN [Clostridiales bacterium]